MPQCHRALSWLLPPALIFTIAMASRPAAAVQARKCLAIVNGAYQTGSNLTDIDYGVKYDRYNIAHALALCGFDVDTSGSDLTRDQMHDKVKAYFDATSPNDVVIFYFSGHGSTSMARPGLFGVDGYRYLPSQLASDTSPMDGPDARPLNKIYIFDECGSGAFASFVADSFPNGTFGQTKTMFAAVEETSCGYFYASLGGADPAQGSWLTWAIVEGLNAGADGACGQPADGKITVGEMNCWLNGAAFDRNPDFPIGKRQRHYYFDRGATWQDSLICYSYPVVAVGPESGTLRIGAVRPNPTSGGAEIGFSMPKAGGASISIVDVAGRRVRKLRFGRLEAGPQTVLWDGYDDSGNRTVPGVYSCLVEAGGLRMTRTVVVVR